MTDTVRVLIPVLFLSALEVFEFLAFRKEGSDIFPPKFGWRLFYFIVIAGFLVILIEYFHGLNRVPGGPSLWVALLAPLVFMLARPQSIVVSPEGLASYGLWGLRRRFVPWVEVSSVTSDWQEDTLKGWVFTGYKVAVTGRDGTRIEHTILQRHQGKFLDDLRQHVPASAFAPGLFAWHP